MKKISIMIPCFNEIDNVEPMAMAVKNVMEESLEEYDYEILFIDNCSTDGTRNVIEHLCENDKRIKAIFNVTNFGQFNSPFHGLCETTGDCTIALCCDFQDPIEMIPVLVREWEKGHRIVSCVKSSSKERGFIYFLRTLYYKMIKGMSSVKIIEHFTGFGLYDKSFIALLRKLDDPLPFLRGIVAEYGEGFNMITVEYEQAKRRAGKTHNNFYSLYDAAMLSITSYTKVGLRLATLLSFLIGGISFLVAVAYFIYKCTHWSTFDAGQAPLIIGVFMLGALQLFFIGFIGEYVLNINTRVINRPIVVEEKRINFDEEDNNPSK